MSSGTPKWGQVWGQGACPQLVIVVMLLRPEVARGVTVARLPAARCKLTKRTKLNVKFCSFRKFQRPQLYAFWGNANRRKTMKLSSESGREIMGRGISTDLCSGLGCLWSPGLEHLLNRGCRTQAIFIPDRLGINLCGSPLGECLQGSLLRCRQLFP